MHSEVKSLLFELLYLSTLRLFDVIISNNTHRLLVVSTISCRYRAQNNGRPERSKFVQNEELTGQTSNVAFICRTANFLKIRKKIWRKVVRGRRVTLPAEPTLPSVRTTKKLLRLTVNGWPSQSFIHTDFNIPSSIQ